MSTENGHAGRPGKTRRQSCPQKSASRPPSAPPSLVRHFRHGGLNFSSPGMLCPSHTPGSPNLSDSPDTSGCALYRMRRASPSVCRPGAADRFFRHVPPEVCSSVEVLSAAPAPPDTAPKPPKLLAGLSPKRSAAAGPPARPFRAKSLTPLQSVRAPLRRTNASAPRTKVHEKTRGKAPRKGDSSPRHASKGKNA